MTIKKRITAFFLAVCLITSFSIPSFAAEAKWVLVSGKWMYKTESGTYKKNSWLLHTDNKWYRLDTNGQMLTGWSKVDNTWYNFNPSGIMRTGWLQDRGEWYCLGPSGGMRTGWIQQSNVWYYLNPTGGTMRTGWLEDKVNNKWYYMDAAGVMAAGSTKVINGVSHSFDASGMWTGNNGNGQTTGFRAGSWTDKTFSNPWSGIKLTIPADTSIFTAEQMKNNVGSGQKILVNDGTITVDKANAYADTIVYDFMLRLGDNNSIVQLSYLNVSVGGASMTAEQYGAALGDQLIHNATLPHTVEGTERVTIGGKEYVKLKTTMLARSTNQDIYMRKTENFIVMLTATYQPGNASRVNTVISSITVAN